MNKNPLIREPLDSADIESTLGCATFVLAAMQHALDTEHEPVSLTWDVAQGHILNLQSVINTLNTVATQVELMRKELSQPALKEVSP